MIAKLVRINYTLYVQSFLQNKNHWTRHHGKIKNLPTYLLDAVPKPTSNYPRFFSRFSVTNGKYVDDTKYIHAVNIIDDPKYGSSCHLEDPSLKQSHYGTPTTACQPGDESESLGIVKSEDGVSHSYVLPPFLRWSKCFRQNVLNMLYSRDRIVFPVSTCGNKGKTWVRARKTIWKPCRQSPLFGRPYQTGQPKFLNTIWNKIPRKVMYVWRRTHGMLHIPIFICHSTSPVYVYSMP